MSYPLLDAFWTILLFFVWLLWIFTVVWILFDVFSNHRISNWGKAGWALLVIVLPLIGILAYVIVHGDHLSKPFDWRGHETRAETRAQDEADRAGGTSSAFELSKLADLHDRGVITDAEFQRQKEQILS
jgi:Short C-terminal domain/Phospholipase_D-nuclease N-terminal